MKVAIHQPNYLPWLGYYRKLIQSDVFVFFDNVQLPRGKSFTIRTAIKGSGGRQWLSVPIGNKSDMPTIDQVRVADHRWERKHLKTLQSNYSFSQWKGLVAEYLAPVLEQDHDLLADLNIKLIHAVLEILGVDHVRLVRASEMELTVEGAGSIDEILAKLGATTYLTGQGKGTARHLDEEAMSANGVKVEFVSDELPAYPQRHGEFEAGLSIMDAILNVGPEQTLAILKGEA